MEETLRRFAECELAGGLVLSKGHRGLEKLPDPCPHEIKVEVFEPIGKSFLLRGPEWVPSAS
jgi:hypothetical protein